MTKIIITLTKVSKLLILILIAGFTNNVLGQDTYIWKGIDNASWAVSTNWTPTRTAPAASDILQFNTGTTLTITSVPSQFIGRFVMSNNTNITLQASNPTRILTIGNGTLTDLEIPAGSELMMGINITLAESATANINGTLIIQGSRTFNTNGVSVVTTINGTLNNQGTITNVTAGKLLFTSGSFYIHAMDGGTIPIAAWNAASTCSVNGVDRTAVNGLDQNFGNFRWNNTLQSRSFSLPTTGTISISGTLEINSTGSGTDQLQLNQTSITVANYNQTGGNFAVASATNRSLTVTGNVSVSAGTLTMSRGAGTGTLNVAGDFSHTAGTITETSTGSGLIIFNKTGIQTYTSGGTVSNTINYTVNSGSTLQMSAAGTFITGGTFTLSSGAGLGITSAAGITTVGTAAGNIQTAGRSFSTGANYTYNGGLDQVTGTGLPGTIGTLSIDNAGFTVTMQDQNRSVVGDLNVLAGKFDLGTFTADRSVAGGALTVAGTLKLAAADNFPKNFSTVTLAGSTIEYNGLNTVTQTISAIPSAYHNLILTNTSGSGTAVKNFTGNLTINNDFTINSGCQFTIPALSAVTVTGTLTNNSGAAGLLIRSTSNGTGTLMHNSAGVSGTVERYLTANQWHIVSPPVSGQDSLSFVTNVSNAIPTSGSNYGMMDYKENAGGWKYYTNPVSSGSFLSGSGFLVRRTSDGIVTFSGTLVNSATIPISRSANGWNSVGNPFTSSILVRGMTPTNNFLGVNANQLDRNFAALYIYDPNNPTHYRIINNTNSGHHNLSQDYIQPGQGFIIRSKHDGGNISFTSSMMVQQNSVMFYKKSASAIWPEINLKVTTTKKEVSTVVLFYENMTRGLDVTYDAGMFGGDPALKLYTRLVEDNGTDFAIQCLPDAETEAMIIPVGLDFPAGGLVTFSAEIVSLPARYKAILEDRTTGIMTNLNAAGAKYDVILPAGTSGTGRFFIHTLSSPNAIESVELKKITTYSASKEIFIKGLVNENTTVILYDLYGRMLKTVILEPSEIDSFRVDELSHGIYIVKVLAKDFQVSNRLFIE